MLMKKLLLCNLALIASVAMAAPAPMATVMQNGMMKTITSSNLGTGNSFMFQSPPPQTGVIITNKLTTSLNVSFVVNQYAPGATISPGAGINVTGCNGSTTTIDVTADGTLVCSLLGNSKITFNSDGNPTKAVASGSYTVENP